MLKTGAKAGSGLLLMGAAVALTAGCIPVQVQAPDRPIEINLNVNIRHEVIVRLDQEARDLLNDNPDLFGDPR
ncbi:hypothetical protein U91I_00031 [alpha proteobacterium U9-1i]|nr:hypothetical protein U91I_00031 [alpha proteobacterium U9-1i]